MGFTVPIPDATDTDFDGLADGQELFVKSVKTPKRYPTQDQLWVSTDTIDLALGAPGWAISGMSAMVGFTHGDMGQIAARLERWTGTANDLEVYLRTYANAGQSNNFTSYDLLNSGFARDEFVAGGTWSANVYDRTAGGRGQVEYYQIQLTVRTLPNRADTDADGLNDSVELNLGSDGFSTDPWKIDTDGDTLLDTEYATKGTSPLLADTDRDGVRDESDLVPLGDAFVEISIDSTYVIGSDPHNPNDMPNPFVKVAIQGNATYTTPYWDRSAVWYTFDDLNRYDGHGLSVNVPDDASTTSIVVEMWSYDSRGYNEHLPVGIKRDTSFGGCSDLNKTTITYPLQPAGHSTTYHLSGGCASSPRYASPLNITVTTIIPPRIGASLIVPKDYAGVYNVTNAQGGLVGRRYVGEPRFVAILLNVTTWDNEAGCYCGPAVPSATLVPRSVFYETRLYAYLNDSNPISPLDKLTFRQNSTSASSNSDVLQQILTGNVTEGDAFAIFNLLLENETGYNVRIGLTLTNDLFLYSLPDDAVRFVAYKPPPTAPSWTYTFCSGSCSPTTKPWWELVWTGLLIVAAVLSAVILPINAFLVLVQVLAQVGAWVWTNIVGPGIEAVANAVEAAGEVLGQFVDFLIDFAISLLASAVDHLLRPLVGMAVEWAALVNAAADAAFMPHSPPLYAIDFDSAYDLFVDVLTSGVFFMALTGLIVALAIAHGVITAFAAASAGTLGVLAPYASQYIAEYFIKGVLSLWVATTALSAGVAAMFYLFKPEKDPFWKEGVGLAAFGIASFATVFITKWSLPKQLAAVGYRDGAGLFLALMGLVLSLVDNTILAWLSLALEVIGFGVVLLPDALDQIPINPIRNIEEVISLVAIGHSAATLARIYGK